ncbi:ABC transporter ATP-binding protein [Cellulomonas sp. JZ18]|uniref:ABC transporter ATP-binding protein n=1 Tax=Cellulomonas sp. JZ18 TaxID=2654191 RepID=UPI0018AFFC16|nr:ATP-binding cassette domain-containing protein [Cellulomonas sp. JZ18]
MTEGAAPVLRARGLDVHVPLRSGEVLTLGTGLDLDLARGRSLAVVGRSGCGKTTLLATLGLLRRPSAGRLWLMGEEVTAVPDARAARLRNARIGFVFQDCSLVAHLSVLDNVLLPVEYGAHVRRRDARRAASAQLEAVGLAGFERRRPRQLSGGEQQRVAVARALVRGPQLVLADEPTGALDTSTGEDVMAHLLAACRQSHAAAVVVTHDDTVACALDERAELRDGALHRPVPA